jgi:hypothetical protein
MHNGTTYYATPATRSVLASARRFADRGKAFAWAQNEADQHCQEMTVWEIRSRPLHMKLLRRFHPEPIPA